MKIPHPEKAEDFSDWIYSVPIICEAFTALSGGLVLSLWYLGIFDQIYPGQKFVTMADETALLFVLMGIAIPVYIKSIRFGKISTFLVLSAALTLIISVFAIIDFGTDHVWKLGDFLRSGHVMMGAIQTGMISLPTAFCFILFAVALLLMQVKVKQLSVVLSSLNLFIG